MKVKEKSFIVDALIKENKMYAILVRKTQNGKIRFIQRRATCGGILSIRIWQTNEFKLRTARQPITNLKAGGPFLAIDENGVGHAIILQALSIDASAIEIAVAAGYSANQIKSLLVKGYCFHVTELRHKISGFHELMPV